MSDLDFVFSEDENVRAVTVGRSVEVPPFGNLRPFLKGRLLWSPQSSRSIFALLAQVGSTVLFVTFWGSLRFTDPNLLHHEWMTQVPDIMVLVLSLLCVGLLLATSLTNPGILLKNEAPPTMGSPAVKSYYTTLPYCMTCHIYRPSSAGHCIRCNNCVAQFDHHCRLLGCCIGELNRRFFLLLLLCITLYTMVISICLGYFLVIVPPGENLLRYILFTIGLAVAALLSLVFLGYLLHNLRLIRMGLLHREFMKGAAPRGRGRMGFFSNLLQVCCLKKECG